MFLQGAYALLFREGGIPTLAGGVPTLVGKGTHLGEPPPSVLAWPGGVPTLARGYLPWDASPNPDLVGVLPPCKKS